MAQPLDIRENRPSYASFERVAIEDRAATIANNGRYTTKDVDMAMITPAGSKDRIPRFVGYNGDRLPPDPGSWFEELDMQVREERMPPGIAQQYKDAYFAWRRGQEVPLNGTPIKGWSVLSPSQQHNVIASNVLTVEDLAQANAEALGRIGMGAMDLKKKAETWLKASNDVGKVVTENEGLLIRCNSLEAQNATLTLRVKELEAELERAKAPA